MARDKDLERTLWRKAGRLTDEARVVRVEAVRQLEVARRLEEQAAAVLEDLRSLVEAPESVEEVRP